MASGPEMRITAMAPVPEGVAKATMLSLYNMESKIRIQQNFNMRPHAEDLTL
jgi:hypothetical protein